MYQHGQSFSTFTEELLLAHKNGVDVDNINHNKEFPLLFLKSVYETFKTKMVNYLSTALPSTSHPPILNFSSQLQFSTSVEYRF